MKVRCLYRLTGIILLVFPLHVMPQTTPIDVYNSQPFLDETGVLLQDGDIIHIIYTGPDGNSNPPSVTGNPTGDDVLLSSHQVGENAPSGTGTFFTTMTVYPDHSSGYPAAGDYIYARVFNNQYLPDATAYGNGQLHMVTNQLGDFYNVQLDGGGTGVLLSLHSQPHPPVPEKYRLYQNYPNPFNSQTKVRIDVPYDIQINKTSLIIYDVGGSQIKEFLPSEMRPGINEVIWDGRNDQGLFVSSGCYIFLFQTLHFQSAIEMFMVR